MEAYKVWSTFDVKGNAYKEIDRIFRMTGKADVAIKGLIRNLRVLDKTNFFKLNQSVLKSQEAFSLFNTSVGSSSRKIESLTLQTKALSDSLTNLERKALGTGKALTRMNGGGIGKAARGTKVGGGGMLGSGMMLGGYAAYEFMHKGFEENKEYEMQLSQLKALGFGDEFVSKASRLAQTAPAGISKNEMLEAVVASQMATRAGAGQWNEVQMMAPELAKGALAMGVTYGGQMTDKQQKDLVRFAEIQGGSDPKKQLAWLRSGISMMITSGGTIAPNQQLQFARLTSGSLRLTPEAYLAMEPVLQELGSRTGVGLTTLSRALTGGMTMTGFSKKNIKFWQKVGLFKGTFDKVGRPLGVDMPDQWKKLFSEDTPKFFTDVVFPLLGKAGIKGEENIHQAINAFPRTGAMVGWTLYKNMTKVERARAMSRQVLSGEGLQSEIEKTPGFASKAFQSSWDNFTLSFGRLTAGPVILGMNKITALFNNLAYVLSGDVWKQLYGNFRSIIKPSALGQQATEDAKKFVADSKTPTQNVIFNMDGRKLASGIMPHLSNLLNPAGAVSSTNAFNASFSMPPVGLTNYGSQQ